MCIFKHTLESSDSILSIGWKSRILTAKNQRDQIVVYYAESFSQRKRQIRIKTFLTGEELPDISNMHFLDTVLLNDDSFVVHVFWESIE